MRKRKRFKVRRAQEGKRLAAAWQTEAVRRWDRMFGGYRLARRGSPCVQCGCKCACDYVDQYCASFVKWYAAAFDEAAARLRNLAKEQRSAH